MYDIEVQSENDSRLYPAGETQGHARIRQPETWVHAAPDAASARLSQYTYGEPLRILDIQPTSLHQRVPLYVGSKNMVGKVMEMIRDNPDPERKPAQ